MSQILEAVPLETVPGLSVEQPLIVPEQLAAEVEDALSQIDDAFEENVITIPESLAQTHRGYKDVPASDSPSHMNCG